MPVGNESDPDSAVGVISRLGDRPVVTAAVCMNKVVGCVLGAVLTPDLIQAYGLDPWQATPGDGLLAFIGIAPDAQGSRVTPGTEGWLLLNRHPINPSLARYLFEHWLGARELADCPRLFIRTRRRIGAIRYLSDRLGFVECGGFDIDFRGQRQRRLVYRREHAAATRAHSKAAP
ncbi:hypothetical protein [Roseibium sp. Sym1]|uniref:hypothetical protein n=1 Tax=Roseibium sp. Sym1 TaxID=3016006 RepID=UPI0022B53799|nr:hypothetical protein [Roseibium sp. Sym1]